MDIDKLINCINSDTKTKKLVFEKYIKNEINIINKEYEIVKFNNGNLYDIFDEILFLFNQTQSIENNINTFEHDFNKILEKIKPTISKLNENFYKLNLFLDKLKSSIIQKYHLLNKLEIKISNSSISKNNFGIDVAININKKDYSFSICPFTLKSIYEYNDMENYILKQINENIIKFCEGCMRLKFDELYNTTSRYYYYFYFSDTDKLIKNIEYFYIPYDIFYDKNKFLDTCNEIDKMIKSDIYKRYLIQKTLKFNIAIDMYDFNVLEKTYNEIKFKEKERHRLLKEKDINKMYDFDLCNYYKITKCDEKTINNDHYVVYKFFVKKRMKKIIFFKNGNRVGRTHYNEVKKLLDYNRKINVFKHENVNWNKISKLPLSEEQIDKYANKLNWLQIVQNRPLSNYLLKKYCDKIYWKILLKKRKIDEKLLNEIGDKIGWNIISKYANVSIDFVLNNTDKINFELLHKNENFKYIDDIINNLIGE